MLRNTISIFNVFWTPTKQKYIGLEREVIAIRKDGRRFPANLAVGHGIISEGRHIFVGFISDISQQKLAEQELQTSQGSRGNGGQNQSQFSGQYESRNPHADEHHYRLCRSRAAGQ